MSGKPKDKLSAPAGSEQKAAVGSDLSFSTASGARVRPVQDLVPVRSLRRQRTDSKQSNSSAVRKSDIENVQTGLRSQIAPKDTKRRSGGIKQGGGGNNQNKSQRSSGRKLATVTKLRPVHAPLKHRRVLDKATGQCVAEGHIIFGERDGEWMLRYRTGERRASGAYFQGDEYGIWSFYHKNNTRAATGEYVDGDEHGFWDYWYDNGISRATGRYHYGDMHGTWTYRSAKGKIERVEEWEKGRLIRRLSVR